MTGKWLDTVFIAIVLSGRRPGGRVGLLCAGLSENPGGTEKGHKGKLSDAGFTAKYIYVPLTVLVLILGFVYKGIG